MEFLAPNFYHSPGDHFNTNGARLAEHGSGKEREIHMGVIGRLDDQVDEIIIKPVGARREAAEGRAPQTHETQPAPPAEEEAAQDAGKTGDTSPELPVWLL